MRSETYGRIGWLIAASSYLLSAGILFSTGNKGLAALQILVVVLCGGILLIGRNLRVKRNRK